MPKPITIVEPKVMPDPKLEKRTRRIFTVEYRLSIIQQADACKHGELGALLRREKLYSNQKHWLCRTVSKRTSHEAGSLWVATCPHF